MCEELVVLLMNWVTTILMITVAALLATVFHIRKENKPYRRSSDQGTTYKYVWLPALLINLVIGILVGFVTVGIGLTAPFITAFAIGTFLIVMIADGVIFDNERTFIGGIIILVILLMPASWIMLMQGVENAAQFDTMLTTTTDDLFENEIPDNMVRLVTEEYAEFIVRKQALADYGSNRKIAATSIVSKDGRLVWVCVIVSTNTFAENYVQGMVVVDANTATVLDIIQSHEIDFTLAEGLFWWNNIQASNYWNDAKYKYSDAYPTWDDDGNLVYVQTRTHVDGVLAERPAGPIIYYQGQTPTYYDTINDAPDWLPRAYSEDWLERQVDRWGSHRRGAIFDFWAGGILWVPPSNDRLEMSEDVRYILNPDSMKIEALVVAHPIVAELSLKGVFRGTATGVVFHDYSDRNFIAGQAAIDNIVGSLTKPSQGHYEGAMPLLYPITIGNETKWTWYCPIYFYRTVTDESTVVTNIELHSLAMIDATDARTYFIQDSAGGYIGEELVQMTKAGYAELFGASIDTPTGNETVITSDVLGRWIYDDDGTSNIVLQTNSTEAEFIIGTVDDMNYTDWLDLLTIEFGEVFRATIVPMESGQYRIIAFERLD